jgi:plasmid replication initiation protein
MASSNIYKANALVSASYRLSVQEQRILLSCIAQIDVEGGEVITDEKLYSVRVFDIENMSDHSSKNLYLEIKNAAASLFERQVTLNCLPNGNGKRKTLVTRWVQSIEYDEKESSVNLRFSRDIAPYLTNLSSHYTKYHLKDVAKLSSAHAVRIFELMMQWKSVGKATYAIEELREILLLKDEYPKLSDFKKRVLSVAQQQINLHTPYLLSIDQQKYGKKVTHIVFNFSLKDSPKKKKLVSKKPTKKDLQDPKFLSKHGRPGEDTNQVIRRLKEQFDI